MAIRLSSEYQIRIRLLFIRNMYTFLNFINSVKFVNRVVFHGKHFARSDFCLCFLYVAIIVQYNLRVMGTLPFLFLY